jgi:hypothetical protein
MLTDFMTDSVIEINFRLQKRESSPLSLYLVKYASFKKRDPV